MQTCACILPHMHTQTHLPGRYLKALNSLLRVLTHFETDIFDSQPSHSPNSQWPKWKIAQCGTENPTTKSTTATKKIPRPNLPTFVRLPNMMLLINQRFQASYNFLSMVTILLGIHFWIPSFFQKIRNVKDANKLARQWGYENKNGTFCGFSKTSHWHAAFNCKSLNHFPMLSLCQSQELSSRQFLYHYISIDYEAAWNRWRVKW